jgi:hypothetical protein
MSFKDCIINAENEGTITRDQANEARDLFDELEGEYKNNMNDAAASAKAAKDTFDTLEFMSAEKKRQKLLQIQNWTKITANLESYRDLRGQVNYEKAALALLDRDDFAKYANLESRTQAINRAATTKMSNILYTFRRNALSVQRNKAQLKEMIREVFEPGSTKSTSARELADAWKQTSEYLRKRFNAAGGHIPKRTDWGLPQFHDVLSVRKASLDEWTDFILPRLDVSKMIDEKTKLPFDQVKLRTALRDVYETITTDGYAKIIPGRSGQGMKLSNRRVDHRFLVFKDANNWIEYQEKFGNPNAFDTMIGHINSMSRDIAQLEILGPNPKSTIKFIQESLIKRAQLSKDAKAINKAQSASKKIEDLYLAISGRAEKPIDGFFPNIITGLKNIITSSFLGGASISSITDLNSIRIAKQFIGMPQTRTLTNYLKQLAALPSAEKQQLGLRLGLIAESYTALASGSARYTNNNLGPELTRRIADSVLNISGLTPMTQAGRWAFGMEFMGYMADSLKKSWNDLDVKTRNTLEKYNIGEVSWNKIKEAELYEYEGATFLRAEDIESMTGIPQWQARELATRYMEMIVEQTNFAVPSSSRRGRLALTGNVDPNTIAGGLLESFAMFKNFSITIINTHVIRGITQQGMINKAKYLTNFAIGNTLLGALAIQLKEISKGRDPRPMTSPEFWMSAILQGGGLGIFGDFLFQSVNRYGGGLSETIAGPIVGFANDLRNLTIGNLGQAMRGDDTNATQELIRFAAKYQPGSSIWYTRLAYERLLIEQLQLMNDPQYRNNLRRIERNYYRNYGQEYWWRPGQTAPERLPEIESALKPAP